MAAVCVFLVGLVAGSVVGAMYMERRLKGIETRVTNSSIRALRAWQNRRGSAAIEAEQRALFRTARDERERANKIRRQHGLPLTVIVGTATRP